jgi:hypothetical protein
MRRWWITALLVVGASVASVAPAVADHLEAETTAPDTIRVGDVIEMRVVVRSADTKERVPGATVIAEREASIAGFTGRVEVARATTNELGVATLRWRERTGTTNTIVVAYAGEGETELESLPLSVVTVGSDDQIVRSTSGVRIPGFGAWVLIAILVGVWAIIQFAMVGPVHVARIAAESDQPDEDGSP